MPDSLQDELELLDLQARWYSASASSQSIGRLRTYALSERAPQAHRAQAALLGMIAADSMFDDEALKLFHDALQSGIPDCPDAHRTHIQAEIIYRSSLGEFDEACRMGETLVSLARESKLATVLASALRIASHPFRRANRFDVAQGFLLEASDLARRHHLVTGLSRSQEQLAWLFIDYQRAEEALEHLSQCNADQTGDLTSNSIFTIPIATTVALIKLDRWEEARLLSGSIADEQYDLANLALALVLAVRVFLAAHSNDVASCEDCLTKLDRFNRSMFRRVGQDLIAEAYSLGLEIVRGTSEARQFAAWYLTEARRDLFPPSPALYSLAFPEDPSRS